MDPLFSDNTMKIMTLMSIRKYLGGDKTKESELNLEINESTDIMIHLILYP